MRITTGLASSEDVFGIVRGSSTKLVPRNALIGLWPGTRKPVSGKALS